MKKIRSDHVTPEDINDSPSTAPSKRIKSIIPDYIKIIDGIAIAETIGIEKMMSECPHFKEWINKILSMPR